MKHVLVLTDFSNAAQNALKFVLTWLQDAKIKCHILLLNTYLIPPAPVDELIRINDDLRETSQKKLRDELRQIDNMTRDSDITFELLSYMGSVKNVLNYLSTDKNIQFISICDSAIMDVGPLVLLKCPVLTIPTHAVYSGIKKIALIQNGTDKPGRELLPKWEKMFDETKLSLSVVTNGTSEAARDFAKKNQIDLFVYPYGSNPASKTPALSTLSQIQAPVLFLRPQE